MKKTTLAVGLLFLASAASANRGLMQTLSSIAKEIGLSSLLEESPAPSAPEGVPGSSRRTPRANKPARFSTTYLQPFSYPLTANGSVSCKCFSHDEENAEGTMEGTLDLNGEVPIYVNGAYGKIMVTGTAYLGGTCRRGRGLVQGTANVAGSGLVYYKGGPLDGQPAGTVYLKGGANVSEHVAAYSAITFALNVYITGQYDAFRPAPADWRQGDWRTTP